MSLTPTVKEFWHNLCTNAFNENTLANDFILFFDGCKTASSSSQEGQFSWKTTNPDYQYNLQQLGCTPIDKDTFTLSVETVAAFTVERRNARSVWHTKRQMELKQHLQEALRTIGSFPLDLSNEHKVALIKEFVNTHENDLGSVPFLRRLAGFMRYQIQHKDHVAEWQMSEYILTQNTEEAMESYIRLLRGVLGMQLVYHDDEDHNNNDNVAIDMDNKQVKDPQLTWRMSTDIDLQLLRDSLEYLPKQTQTFEDYTTTDIPRKNTLQNRSIFQWIFDMLGQCLSFLHK